MDPRVLLQASSKPKISLSQYEMVLEKNAEMFKSIEMNKGNLDSLTKKLWTVLRPLSARYRKNTQA